MKFLHYGGSPTAVGVKQTSAFWLLAAAGRASCALKRAQPLSRVAKDRYNFNVRFRSGAVASRRRGSGRVTIKVMSACFMLSRLVPFWFALMLGLTVALADARQDCARASGD